MVIDVVYLVLYCLFFLLFFVKGISGKGEWKQRGMTTGFVVALFAEMWGFPLSIFVITSMLGSGNLPYQFDNLFYYFIRAKSTSDSAFSSMPTIFFFEYSFARGLTLLSVFPIIYGWFHLKQNINNGLVTNGPYAYSRNPQYVGFMLFIVGMVLYWPTLITIPMGCILCVAYFKLALSEEKDLRQTFKEAYLDYAEKVARFVGKDTIRAFRLPRNLSIIEKIIVSAFLIPFALWFAESVLGLFLGEAFVRAYWLPIAYLLPIHIGVVISISLIVLVSISIAFKKLFGSALQGKSLRRR